MDSYIQTSKLNNNSITKDFTKWKLIDFIKIISIAPILLFIYNLITISSNIPMGDDYPAILNFLNLYINANTLKEKLILLFSLHAEHQIVTCKIISLLDYYLFDAIDFKILIYIGNLSILGITIILYNSFKINNNKLLYFTPIFYILFNFSYGQSIVWAMTTLSNFSVVFFALLTLFFICKDRLFFYILSLLTATITTFTFGNGILIFIPILLKLLLDKKYFRVFFSFFLAIMIYKIYYSFGSIVDANRKPLIYNFDFFIKTLIFFITFLGSVLQNVYLSFILGLIIISFFLYLTYIKYYIKNGVVYGLLVFLFFSALATSISRSTFGIEYAIVSRYAFYSSLCLVLCYAAFIELIFFNDIKKAFFSVKILTLIIFPLSILSYLVFPLKTLFEITYSTIPYTYFVQKEIKSDNMSIINAIDLYNQNTKQMNSSLLLRSFPFLAKKVNQKLLIRYSTFNKISLEEGDVKGDALILKNAYNNKVFRSNN